MLTPIVGLVGTGVGLAAASYRNLSPVSVRIRAASVGVNFTIATAAFLGINNALLNQIVSLLIPLIIQLGIREGVVYVHRGAFGKNQTALLSPAGDEYLTSCVSGAITGTLLSVLSSNAFLRSLIAVCYCVFRTSFKICSNIQYSRRCSWSHWYDELTIALHSVV